MSGKRTLSLSAYKKSKQALAVAPVKKERRLGFGESVSTREARAQELQLETRVIKHLDGLLKRCGNDPACAKAISNWLCAEGLEGHAKKGLSRILCHVRVWSRALRAEGVAPRKEGADKAEAKARAAFAACVCAINAVNSLTYRFAETKARDGESELVKTAGEVLTGMTEAMVGAGAGPRARGLHPSEHAQLSGMVESWRKRGAISPPSLQAIEKQLSALEPSGSVSSGDKKSSASTSRRKATHKRAAWVQTPAAAAAHEQDDGGGGSPGATPSASARS
ncbi:unnamed protein product, partial [Scytosiphon promiscuus]